MTSEATQQGATEIAQASPVQVQLVEDKSPREVIEEQAAKTAASSNEAKLRELLGISDDEPSLTGNTDDAPPPMEASDDVQPQEGEPEQDDEKHHAKTQLRAQDGKFVKDDDNALVTIKVNGEERQVTLGDLKRNAQIEQAARQRMTQAAEMQRQAEDRLRQAEFIRQQVIAQAQNGQPQQQYNNDPNSLVDEVAEKLAYGTKDDVRAAVARLMQAQQQQPQGPTPQQIMAAIDQRMEFQARQTNAANKFSSFLNEHTDLTSDPDLAQIVATRAERMMKEDLYNLGADPRELAQLSPLQLGSYHAIAVDRGVARPTQQIFAAAVTDARSRLGASPSAAPSMQARVDAKRKAPAPVMPTATTRTPAPQAQRPLSASELIAQERQARGLRTY
jgi:hypothetical protein